MKATKENVEAIAKAHAKQLNKQAVDKWQLPECFGHPDHENQVCARCLIFDSCVSAKGTPDAR